MADYVSYLKNLYSEKTPRRKREYLIHNFGKYLRTGMTVLELGPGLGEFLDLLRSVGTTDIDIVDRDTGVLEHLKNTFQLSHAWLAHLESLETIDHELRQYDCIFMLQIMEHVRAEALVPMLKVLFRHLKPGGVLLITVPNGGNPLSIVERYSDITHVQLFSENSLKQLVQMCDLGSLPGSQRAESAPEVSVVGYCIPPQGIIGISRSIAQRMFHLFLKALLVVNGGVYFHRYEPNITLVVRKSSGFAAR